ncbi:MAG TPA: hypothetical protein VK308_14230 [Pyrinomonadaceae bacterium]|nr:hypothetical protein [Pyrinomonadaceae bacterium]
MNKTNYLLSAFFLTAVMTITACGQAKKVTAPQTYEKTPETISSQTNTDVVTETVGGKEFSLKNNAGKCQLVFGNKIIDLGIPWQCDFHRSPDKAVRVFPRDFYKEKKKLPKNYKNTQIILIEYSTSNPNNPNDCRTQLQAMKIANGKVTASKLTSNLTSCPPFQWEEKNFVGLFE